jgi:hypothetical protein
MIATRNFLVIVPYLDVWLKAQDGADTNLGKAGLHPVHRAKICGPGPTRIAILPPRNPISRCVLVDGHTQTTGKTKEFQHGFSGSVALAIPLTISLIEHSHQHSTIFPRSVLRSLSFLICLALQQEPDAPPDGG